MSYRFGLRRLLARFGFRFRERLEEIGRLFLERRLLDIGLWTRCYVGDGLGRERAH